MLPPFLEAFRQPAAIAAQSNVFTQIPLVGEALTDQSSRSNPAAKCRGHRRTAVTTIPGQISEPFDRFRNVHELISEALALLASVTITTIVVVEAIGYWGFGRDPGPGNRCDCSCCGHLFYHAVDAACRVPAKRSNQLVIGILTQWPPTHTQVFAYDFVSMSLFLIIALMISTFAGFSLPYLLKCAGAGAALPTLLSCRLSGRNCAPCRSHNILAPRRTDPSRLAGRLSSQAR
jgi:hypothetical protein